MKIPALLTCLLAAVLSALPLSQARADEVSFDVFYNSLGDQGDWYNTPEYGYVWQPTIGYQNDKWRPYSDGYWAQTDDGWTWVSYENFGWACYHYGRWTQLEDIGWVWVPGYQWGPGWVSWRTNDDYVGWAPLPPKAHRVSSQGASDISIDYNDVEPAEGYTSNVDVDYDIGPSHYCFVPVHDFGAPALVHVIVPPAQNITIIEHTTNVTNIIYQNGGGNVVVINNGPDYVFLSHHVNHPIQHLILEHHNDIAYLHEHLHGGNPTLVKNGTLFIPSPFIEHRRVDFNQVRPPTVKREIRDVRVEHGWRNSGADQPTVQRLRNQFQEQAREHPSRQPGNPTVNNPPGANDPRRERDRERTNVAPTPGNSPAATNQPFNRTDDDRRARRDAAQRDREAREAARNNGGQPTPGAERDNRRQPGSPDATRPPASPQANPNEDPRRHGPRLSDTPASSPGGDRQNQRRVHQDEQPATTPGATPQDSRHGPRQQEASQNSPADSDRRAERRQEQDQRQQAQQDQTRAREQQQQQRSQDQAAQRQKEEQQRSQAAQQHQQDQQRQQEKRSQEQDAQRQQQAQQHEHEQAQRQQQAQQAQQHEKEQAQRRPEPQPQQQPQNQNSKSDDDKKKRRDGQPTPQ